MHERSEGATKDLRVYKILDSTVHVYNCFRLYLQYNVVLLFAVYKSSYDNRTWQFSTK